MVIVTKGGGVEGGGGLKPLWLGKKLRSKKKRKICCSLFSWSELKTNPPPSTLHLIAYKRKLWNTKTKLLTFH